MGSSASFREGVGTWVVSSPGVMDGAVTFFPTMADPDGAGRCNGVG